MEELHICTEKAQNRLTTGMQMALVAFSLQTMCGTEMGLLCFQDASTMIIHLRK